MAPMDSQGSVSPSGRGDNALRFLLVTVEGWRRLGDLVRQERLKRRRTQAEFAAEIGMSVSQVGNIENAYKETYDLDTLWLVDIAMGWKYGSAERVSKGLDPEVEPEPDMPRRLRELWAGLTPEQREAVIVLMEQMRRPIDG
jgi:transcriptional regulator with XRE-family HTH domain